MFILAISFMFNKTRTQITASIELFKDNYVFKTGAVYIMMLSAVEQADIVNMLTTVPI